VPAHFNEVDALQELLLVGEGAHADILALETLLLPPRPRPGVLLRARQLLVDLHPHVQPGQFMLVGLGLGRDHSRELRLPVERQGVPQAGTSDRTAKFLDGCRGFEMLGDPGEVEGFWLVGRLGGPFGVIPRLPQGLELFELGLRLCRPLLRQLSLRLRLLARQFGFLGFQLGALLVFGRLRLTCPLARLALLGLGQLGLGPRLFQLALQALPLRLRLGQLRERRLVLALDLNLYLGDNAAIVTGGLEVGELLLHRGISAPWHILQKLDDQFAA
jgi:hypothetical protein